MTGREAAHAAGSSDTNEHKAERQAEQARDAPTWQLTFQIVRRGDGERGTETQVRLPSGGKISIGRTPDNEIAFPQSNVSRRHCFVEVHDDGIATVSDSGSSNGTFLNGYRVSSAPMHTGDKLFVGDYLLTLMRAPERIG